MSRVTDNASREPRAPRVTGIVVTSQSIRADGTWNVRYVHVIGEDPR